MKKRKTMYTYTKNTNIEIIISSPLLTGLDIQQNGWEISFIKRGQGKGKNN